jgi:hypothetical protein
MVLKVLDKHGLGSSFDVSCALSYANQRNANVINLSLGYIGAPDSILNHYSGLSFRPNRNYSVPIIAAAGNTEGTHDLGKVCDLSGNGLSQLPSPELFYPACFDLANIMSVTGLAKNSMHCFYQNYSKEYITLGVVNQLPKPCCGFRISFFPNQIREGSSFAAPVVSGKVMTYILSNGMQTSPNQYLLGINPSFDPGSNRFTKKGAYITY